LLSPFASWCLVALLDAFQSSLGKQKCWGREPFWRLYPWHEALRLYSVCFLCLLPLGLFLLHFSRKSGKGHPWMASVWSVLPMVVFLSLLPMLFPWGDLVQLISCAVLFAILLPVFGLLFRSPQRIAFMRSDRFVWAIVMPCMLLLVGGSAWNYHRTRNALSSTPLSSPNVVLISLDTLRADRLGCYDSDRPNSPAIDAFAEESVLFERAYAQAPYTLPSHVSLLTSLYPDTHGVLAERTCLAEEVDALAEVLEWEGYATAAFVESGPDFFVGASYGLSQGFQYYGHFPDNLAPANGLLLASLLTASRERFFSSQWDRSHRIASAAARWIRQSRSRPFFLFLHLFAVHAEEEGYPYHPYAFVSEGVYPTPLPESTYQLEGKSGARFLKHLARPSHRDKIDQRLVQSVVSLYERGVRYVDGQVALVLQALRGRGLWNETIVVLTADHGEQFYEAGGFLHNDLYEQVVRVPLIVKEADPKPGSFRISRVVQSIDIAPTVCDLVKAPIPEGFQGKSLLPWESEDEGVAMAGYWDNVALWKGPWKLWAKEDSVTWEGPKSDEREDQAVRADMESLLEKTRSECRERARHRRREASSNETDRLKELGYLD